MRTYITRVALGLAAFGLAAPLAATADADRILIRQFMFQPTTLTIKAGATVTWLNQDEEPHTVVSASGLFRSAALDTNEQFSFTFRKPGSYPFVCSIHPQMIGTIIVH
jgi:plastocyanin